MGILQGIAIAIIWILLIAFIRSITTLFHEMGHALPSLAFSDEAVTVYVGSYGDLTNTQMFKIGRLTIYFKFNFFDWKIGMCTGARDVTLLQHAIIILGGPLASVLIAGLIYLCIDNSDNQILVFFASAFAVAAITDFFINIIPSNSSIQMHDGGIMYNDGQQLLGLINRSRMPEGYLALEKLFFEKEYDQVAHQGYAMIQQKDQPRAIYNLILSAFIELKQNEDALHFYKIIKGKFELDNQDYLQIGRLYENMNNFPEALKFYDHYLHYFYSDFHALNRRGKIHLNRSSYELAAMDFQSAVMYSNGRFPEALANLGMALFRLEDKQKAYEVLIEAKEIAPELPNVYYYLGLYFEDKGDPESALEHYKKAKDLGTDYHGIDYKIDTLEN